MYMTKNDKLVSEVFPENYRFEINCINFLHSLFIDNFINNSGIFYMISIKVKDLKLPRLQFYPYVMVYLQFLLCPLTLYTGPRFTEKYH